MTLTACSSTKLSFSEIENVPDYVAEVINPENRLQSINDGKGSYIVFHSSGDVEANLETKGDTIIIKFDEANLQGDAKPHTFYLTTSPEYDVLDVWVNGESIPFDNVTVKTK